MCTCICTVCVETCLDAFDNPEDPYLPHDILWRQKEQFSDGVGYGKQRDFSVMLSMFE